MLVQVFRKFNFSRVMEFFLISSYITFTYGMKFRTHSSISRYGTRKRRGWRGEVRWSFPGCFCTSLWILQQSKCIYINVRYFYRQSVSLNSLCYANNQQNQYCDESYYSLAEWSVRHQTRWKRRNKSRIQEFKKRGGGVQARYNCLGLKIGLMPLHTYLMFL